MPTIHDYSTLQTQIRLWAARNDSDFLAALPEFIHMAEQRISYGSAEPRKSDPVRVRDMQTITQLTITAGVAPLPTDYLEQSSMTFDSSLRKGVQYRPQEEFDTIIALGDLPTVFTIKDDELFFLPAVTGKANFTYYVRYPELINPTDTNWLLLNAPSVYFKGSLIEAFGFSRNKIAQDAAFADYIAAADGLTMQGRKAIQPARMYPSIPGTQVRTFRGSRG